MAEPLLVFDASWEGGAPTGFTTGGALTRKKWRSGYFLEPETKQFFAPMTKPAASKGSEQAVIVRINDLQGAGAGDRIRIPLIPSLPAAGHKVAATTSTGGPTIAPESGILWGNEERVAGYYQDITVEEICKALVAKNYKMGRQRVTFDVEGILDRAMKDWWKAYMEHRYFHTLVNDYAGGTARVHFKNDRANAAAVEVGDTLDVPFIKELKLMAELADPEIQPIKLKGGKEGFILLAHNYAIKNLVDSDEWKNNQMYAGARGDANLLFRGATGSHVGDVDGVEVHKHRFCEMMVNWGSDPATQPGTFAILLGAQAMGVAFGFGPDVEPADWDYHREVRLGMSVCYNAEKLTWDDKYQTEVGDRGIILGGVAISQDKVKIGGSNIIPVHWRIDTGYWSKSDS